ncbi:MAG TPA: hypothetical protein ENN55_03665 [Firmicutes bacterium]|nr:hypothetical protein [Bacillota bacterium]
MKMSVFTIFWGVFFILLGLTMILKAFGIDIPFFRIALAVLLIFVGIKILLPGSWPGKSTGKTTMFAESEIRGSDIDGEYSVVLGSSKIDLTEVNPAETKKIKIEVVFGSSEVKIDPKTSLKITGNAVFGEVSMPGTRSVAFGSGTYESETYDKNRDYLHIDATAVFGSVQIK